MRDELQLYRAVQAARADLVDGVRLPEAATFAAKRYQVPREAVIAYAHTAHASCRKAAIGIADEKCK